MADAVVAKCHVLHYRPWSRPAIVSHCEQDGKSILSVQPVLLEEIAFNQYSLGVLKLEEVLHRPRYARVLGVADFPGERLGEVVATDLDIRGYKPRNADDIPSEQ